MSLTLADASLQTTKEPEFVIGHCRLLVLAHFSGLHDGRGKIPGRVLHG